MVTNQTPNGSYVNASSGFGRLASKIASKPAYGGPKVTPQKPLNYPHFTTPYDPKRNPARKGNGVYYGGPPPRAQRS